VLSVIEAGQLSGKFVKVLFDPSNLGGQAFGCLAADCRTILAVILIDNVPGQCEIDNSLKGCPGYCTVHGTTDPSCPQFCAANPSNRQCFCQSHDDMTCPGNCQRHPNNTACDPRSNECLNQRLAGCNPR
jgi:hypothetical protein